MSRLRKWGAGGASVLSTMSARLSAARRAGAGDPAKDEPAGASPGRTGPPEPPTPPVAHGAVPPGHELPPPVAVVPWGMRVAAEVGWRLLVLAGAVWVLMQVIAEVRLVVLAFSAALLITALLQPLVSLLCRLGLPRGLATTATFVTGFVVLGLVGWFVVWQIMENVENLSDSVQDGIEELKQWLLDSPFHVTEEQINDIADNLTEAIRNNSEELTSRGIEGVTIIIEALTGILLCAFCTLFLLYDGPRIWSWVLKLFPPASRAALKGAGPRVWATLTAYVRGTLLVALIDAVFIGTGIALLDVPMAVPLAVIIFLGAFVPLVGAVVSGALAMVVALVTNGPFTALMVLLIVLAVQQIEGHILQPFILGRAVRVHPLAVVLSVACGSLIAGIGGAVVAVPLVAVVNTGVGYLAERSREMTRQRAAALATPGGTPPAPPAGGAKEAPPPPGEEHSGPEDGRGDGP
ncbi:AI-2E family transporter [Streptomyces capparidis]